MIFYGSRFDKYLPSNIILKYIAKFFFIISAPFLLTIEEVLACQERLKAENEMSNFLKPLAKSVTFENLDEKGKSEVERFYESKEVTITDKRHLMARESSIQVTGKIRTYVKA